MKAYLDLVNRILAEGTVKENRTGVDAITVPGAMIDHDMADGFPLLTTKFVPFKLIASELEFFIKGITDKQWLQERNNHIWDQWARPDLAPYGHDEASQAKMKAERDLGPVYGWQWRNFGAKYVAWDKPPEGQGIDQLQNVVDTLKNNPSDRRMIVSAWNPVDKPIMGLPPCHFCWQVTVVNNKLNLLWNIRSVDVAIGMPFNIASYALLLHLLAKESGFEEGHLVGFCADTHIYVNHVDGLKEQLDRNPLRLPTISTERFKSIFDWECRHSYVNDYKYHPKIKFDIAV
jgi:thymidylate synthase